MSFELEIQLIFHCQGLLIKLINCLLLIWLLNWKRSGVSVGSHLRHLKLGADAADAGRLAAVQSDASVDKCCERQQRKRFIGYGNV